MPGFEEIYEELSPKDREYLKRLGMFIVECRTAKRPGQAVMHINGNGLLSEVNLKRDETIKL